MAVSSRNFLLLLVLALVLFASHAHAFGAGNIASISAIEGKNWRHGDIEDLLKQVSCIRHHKWNSMMIKRVYFGNWLRDYSQAMDTGALQKLNGESIRILVWLLSFLGFGYATAEFEVTSQRLGVYRPEEHIDNPKDYNDNKDARQFDPRLRGPIRQIELDIDPQTGMKNYIANTKGDWATSAAFVKYSFERSIHYGRMYTSGSGILSKGKDEDLAEALRLLGQGLHTLEDFGAHTNYVELALVELGFRNVFPLVGNQTGITLRGKHVFPLVTGTFGMVDFYHSVLGEATDHFTQSEVNEMDNAMGVAQNAAASNNPLTTLVKLLAKVPGTKDLCAEAERLQASSQAQARMNTQRGFDTASAGGSRGIDGYSETSRAGPGDWNSGQQGYSGYDHQQGYGQQQQYDYNQQSQYHQSPQPAWDQHQQHGQYQGGNAHDQYSQPSWNQQQQQSQWNQPHNPQSYNMQPQQYDQYSQPSHQSYQPQQHDQYSQSSQQYDQYSQQPQHSYSSQQQGQYPQQHNQYSQQGQQSVVPQQTPSAPTPSKPASTGLPGLPDFDPAKTIQQIYPILAFRDKVVRSISAIIEKIPGLEALVDRIVETLTVFILSLLAPFVRPVIEAISKSLQTGSSGVIDSSGKHQYEVWTDPRSSDPTHSMLSKDHFSNILNPPAGAVAGEILKFIAPRVLYAWEHPDVPVERVMADIEIVFHHPAIRDEKIEVHRNMYSAVKRWVDSLGDRGRSLNDTLSAEGVRAGKNHKAGVDDHAGHGSSMQHGGHGAQYGGGSHSTSTGYGGSSQQHAGGNNSGLGGMFGQVQGLVGGFTGQGTSSSGGGYGSHHSNSGGGGGGGGLNDMLGLASKLPIPGVQNIASNISRFSNFIPGGVGGRTRGIDDVEQEYREIGGAQELHAAAHRGDMGGMRSPSPMPLAAPSGYEQYGSGIQGAGYEGQGQVTDYGREYQQHGYSGGSEYSSGGGGHNASYYQ